MAILIKVATALPLQTAFSETIKVLQLTEQQLAKSCTTMRGIYAINCPRAFDVLHRQIFHVSIILL